MKDKKSIILEEYKKGNIVINSNTDGLLAIPLKDFIEEPIENILYDLNRDEATILTFLNDSKWVNDYACMKVIVALKEKIDKLENTHKNKIK